MAATIASDRSLDSIPQTSEGRWRRLRKRIWANKAVYLFMIPGVLWYVVFHYFPILGNIIAFKDCASSIHVRQIAAEARRRG